MSVLPQGSSPLLAACGSATVTFDAPFALHGTVMDLRDRLFHRSGLGCGPCWRKPAGQALEVLLQAGSQPLGRHLEHISQQARARKRQRHAPIFT